MAGNKVLFLLLGLVFAGCKSTPKTPEPSPSPTAEFRSFVGKKIALVDVETLRGGDTARRVVEVALVNELMKRGTFELLAKEDVNAARTAPDQDPTDWRGVARRAGAEASLRIKVLQFFSEQKEGYSEQEIQDTYLEKETGKEKSKRLYKVKALDSHVEYRLELVDLEQGKIFVDTIEKKSRIVADESKGTSARLPPRLRVLESLSQTAFGEFFDKAEKQ